MSRASDRSVLSEKFQRSGSCRGDDHVQDKVALYQGAGLLSRTDRCTQ